MYRGPGGGIAFSSRKGFVDRPLEVACGQCQGCRLARARDWAIRAVHEGQLHERNCFVTLTYRPECMPADWSLQVGDWQGFAKRVRRELGPFRFLHCGEYGPRTLRPHYHACVFGQDFGRRDWIPVRPGLWTSMVLAERWGLGQVTVGELTWQSAAYVARYVMGKATGELAESRYERVDPDTGECWQVRPEYSTMSRRPGLGAEWFDRFYESDVAPRDEVVHAGKSYRVPKFYDRLLESRDPERAASLKAKRREVAGKRAAREFELSSSCSAPPERHLARLERGAEPPAREKGDGARRGGSESAAGFWERRLRVRERIAEGRSRVVLRDSV